MFEMGKWSTGTGRTCQVDQSVMKLVSEMTSIQSNDTERVNVNMLRQVRSKLIWLNIRKLCYCVNPVYPHED